jgi:hypothetical protein
VFEGQKYRTTLQLGPNGDLPRDAYRNEANSSSARETEGGISRKSERRVNRRDQKPVGADVYFTLFARLRRPKGEEERGVSPSRRGRRRSRADGKWGRRAVVSLGNPPARYREQTRRLMCRLGIPPAAVRSRKKKTSRRSSQETHAVGESVTPLLSSPHPSDPALSFSHWRDGEGDARRDSHKSLASFDNLFSFSFAIEEREENVADVKRKGRRFVRATCGYLRPIVVNRRGTIR